MFQRLDIGLPPSFATWPFDLLVFEILTPDIHHFEKLTEVEYFGL